MIRLFARCTPRSAAMLGAVLALVGSAPAFAGAEGSSAAPADKAPAAAPSCATAGRAGPDGRPRCADTSQVSAAKTASKRAQQDRKDCAAETKQVLGKQVTHRVCP